MITNLGLDLEMLILVAKIASIIVAGFAVAYYLRRVMMRLLMRNLPIHIARAVAKAFMYITIAVTLFVAAGTAGINLTGIAIAGGIAGIVLGFALQPVLSNLFAGLFLFQRKDRDTRKFRRDRQRSWNSHGGLHNVYKGTDGRWSNR